MVGWRTCCRSPTDRKARRRSLSVVVSQLIDPDGVFPPGFVGTSVPVEFVEVTTQKVEDVLEHIDDDLGLLSAQMRRDVELVASFHRLDSLWFEDVTDEGALDECAILFGGSGECGLTDTVDLTERPQARLADHRDRIAGKNLGVTADIGEPLFDVVGAVVDGQRLDAKPVGKPGVQGPVSAQLEPVVEFVKPHQNQAQQWFRVPSVVE